MILKDLAQAAGMTPSKAHPYLVSFGRLGLIEQNPQTGQYQLGPAALQLGLSCLNQLDPLKIAVPIAEQLAAKIQQSVALAVWGNLGPTIVRMIESGQPVHVNMRAGTVMSATGTATGKVFASFMPAAKLAQLDHLALGDRVAHGAAQIRTSPAAHIAPAELKAIQSTQLAQALGEPIPGVNALSAPIFDQSGELALALTALGPAQTFDARRDGPIAAALKTAAHEVSSRLGYQATRLT